MTCSNADFRRFLTAAALAALLPALPAQAQDSASPDQGEPSLTRQLLDPEQTPLARPSGPRSLLPPGGGAADVPQSDPYQARSTPDVFFPSGEASPRSTNQPSGSLAARPGESGTGIEVSTLSGVADEGIGLIGPIDGGLAPDLWQGSRRLVIEDGLSVLVPPPPSPAAASLFRRLLVSRGDLPQGGTTGRSILAMRLENLYAAGFAQETKALAGLVPSGELNAQMAAAAARASLALGEPDAACQQLTRLPADGEPDDPYAAFALELGALCQARSGMQVAALLSVDLAREQGASDATFISLATQAAGGPSLNIPSDEIFTSLHYALAQEAGRELPDNVVDRAEPALYPALARNDSLGWPDRLAAAERAVARGLINARDLAEFYRRAIVEGANNANPRVSAFGVALDAPDATARVEAIASAFAETPAAQWPAILPAYSGALRAVNPAMAHADNAVFMTEALSLIGDPMRADAWIGIAITAAPEQTARLEALARIATPSTSSYALPWNPEQTLRATDVRLASEDTQALWLTAAEIRTVAALGLPVPQSIWAQFDDLEMPGRRIPDNTLRWLRTAADGQRTGEAALATFVALDNDLPSELTPASLAAIVEALAASGLEADARQLAVEALVIRAHDGG